MATNIISSIRIDAGTNILPATLNYAGNYSYQNPPLTGTHTVRVTISDSDNYAFMFVQQTRSASAIASNYFPHGADGVEDTAMSNISFVDSDIFSFRAANLFLFPDYYDITVGTLGASCTMTGASISRDTDATNDAVYANKTITVNMKFTSDTGATGTAQVSFNPTDTSKTIPSVVMSGGSGGTCTSVIGEVVSLVSN